MLGQVACLAQKHQVFVSVNLCETVAGEGNYNLQAVVDGTGRLVAKYHKTHPYFTTCFVTPSTVPVVTFNLSSTVTVGIFTCFDILFSQPVDSLLAKGIRVFSYSASIPKVFVLTLARVEGEK